MKKKLLLALLSAVAAICMAFAFTACGGDGDKTDGDSGETKGSPGLTYSLNADGESYTCTGISTIMPKEAIIPSVYNGKPVTAIGVDAFALEGYLEKVILPDSLKTIEARAFCSCSSLTSIDIPAGVTSIGDWAFRDCTNLESIDIPDSVTSIGDYAFHLCRRLESVEFENQEGWKVSENEDMSNAQNIDVSNPATNASNLTYIYYSYYWHRYDA